MTKLPNIKALYCEWAGNDPENVDWGIPGGVNDNTQAVRLTCTYGDYVVAHDFDRETHKIYIEVTEFFSNEDIADMRDAYRIEDPNDDRCVQYTDWDFRG